MSAMNMNLVHQIKGLKPSKSFIVSSKKERNEAVSLGKLMKKTGDIAFDVTSREVKKGRWKVLAV